MKTKPNHQAAAALDHALAMLAPNHKPAQFEHAVTLAGAPFGMNFQQTCANWLAAREELHRAKRRAQLADRIEATLYLFAPLAAAALWFFSTK